MFLRKYGTGSGSDVIIPMVKRGVVDFAVTADWTPASGDVKVSKDGGTEANIGTLPVINGTVGWKFVFSDSELQCKSLTVRVVDSATKAVEDQFFVIETYGHESAMFVVDFSTAAFGANTTAPATPTNVTDAQTAILAKLPESGRAATPADVSPTINFSPTIEPTELSAGSVSAIQSGLALESSVQSVITTLSEGVELDSATRVKLDASQPDYAPAKASDVAVTVTPTVLSSQSVTDIQTGLATSTALADVQTDVDAANNYLSALSTIFAGITSMANWLRRGFRKDAGTQGMIDAQAEINTGGTSTFSGLTDSLEAIRDNQQASTGGASLEDIIAGVQSVSGGIIAAQDESALYITIGDTWTQDVESLGNLADKTVTFAIKTKARDADTAAVVMIVQGTGLTRLNGAATTAGWGSIEILDEAAGDIRLRLESDATSLLTSGTYVDAIKALEDGDDRTLRQRGRTVVSVGVIADIT